MTVLIIGEAWGSDEERIKRPFIGASGRLLNRLLEEAGFLPPGSAAAISPNYNNMLWHKRDQIFADANIRLTNVLNLHPPSNKIEMLCGERWGDLPPIRPGKYLKPEFTHHLDRLRDEIAEIKPSLVIGLGATAVWFVLGTAGIAKLRGAITPSIYGKFLPTYHPAFLLHGRWDLRSVVLMDLMKAEFESHFPEIRRPQRFVYIPESLQDIDYCIREMAGAPILSTDIETVEDQITCIGFAWSKTAALVIPIFDWSKPDISYWGLEEEKQVWRKIAQICGDKTAKLFQNGLYDIRFLWEKYGVRPKNCLQDTMLLHHAMQPEMQKGLGFLGSVYSNEPAWKLMRPRGKGTVKDIREE